METTIQVALRRYPAFIDDAALDAYVADLPARAESGYSLVATCWDWDMETSYRVLGSSSREPVLGRLAVSSRRDANAAQ